MNYILLYFSAFLITFSIIGHGYILSNIINKDLIKLNIGYQGLFGILSLTIISYTTIFFIKHGYTHNLILHGIGIFSFIYFFKEKKNYSEIYKLFLIFSVFFIGLLIIRNHDDFNYYHLTYSLGLTENKILFGLGNFQHGYKHHSSLFFFNSIIFLPFIKFYLFHSLGWFTLIFANYLIIKYLLFSKIKELNFEYFFYLITLLFINFKFFRMGGYGTDVSGQIILLVIFPLIFSSLNLKVNDPKLKINISIIILMIAYSATLKSFFILSFLFLFIFLFFFKFKKIMNIFIFSRTFLIATYTILLLVFVNFAYTGCAIYPIKQTCLSSQLSWSLEKDHVEKMNNWYQVWSKAGAGITYRADNLNEYTKKFNWVKNWYERYFVYKVKETIFGILFLLILHLILFKGTNKEKPDKKNTKIFYALFFFSLILFSEWFYNHPALRYGGYYLLSIIFFAPVSYYLSKKKIFYINKKKTIISLIILSFALFNLKNLSRIKEEFKIVKKNNFPLFYIPNQYFEEIELEENIKVYLPEEGDGCWVTKTPCVSGYKDVFAKKKFGYTIFVSKNKLN